MNTPVLATKLYRPPLRSGFIKRPDLIKRLDDGLQRRLTLISAPAGFGKTTLVSEWASVCRRPVAWLSLDEGDNDPAVFLIYLLTALQTLSPKIGEGVSGILHSSQSQPPIETLLTTLLNELASVPYNFMLVLDDYHVIESQPLNKALTFFIEHLPSQLHMVIATREDPPFPLSRWRVRGLLTELRAVDLRFSAAEASEFLLQMMGLNLSSSDIAALESRTEGWIAGLQLAALSMQGRQDITGFIRAFTGSHRFVLDYLVEEVLQHQSEQVRSFLLQTALLDRFCAPLCNALTGQTNGQEMLELLERGNLFIVPLDDSRQWYRYHHLFAEMLQTHLMETLPERVTDLHRRASDWYERNGWRPDAIHHALAGYDFERAAGLIELVWSAMDLSYQSSTWLGWVKMLPDELVRARPVLSLGFAWALLDGGQLEASESRLIDAQRGLDKAADKMVVVDKQMFRSLPASIATARAYHAMALGSVPDTVKFAKQALELTPPDDPARYIQATSLLGIAQYTSGDLEAAEGLLADFHNKLQKASETSTLMGITFLLADIRLALGRLNDAENSYQQALSVALAHGSPPPIGTSDLYRGLGELYVERNDLEAAARHIQTGRNLGEQNALPNWLHRLNLSLARLKEARGDLQGALVLLDEAERGYIRSPLPETHPVAAFKARLLLRQGRLEEALEWARRQGPEIDEDITFIREYEYVTLARVLIAAGKNKPDSDSTGQAVRLLERLQKSAEFGGRQGSLIQVLVLQALVLQSQGDFKGAGASLKRALTLAEPEGFIRIFIDEGQAMRLLIEKQAHDRLSPLRKFSEKLLAVFNSPESASKAELTHPGQSLIEPLSEREMDVLKLLRSELSGPDMARELIVSLNTLRTHTKSIFNKLGVNNRRAAVRRAQELGLI